MEKYFTIDQKELISLLSPMQPICSKKTILDSTSYILFQVSHKELILKSTDLELSLQYSCPILDSSIDHTESFLVNGRRIFDIIKELEGPIYFNLSNNQLNLKSKSYNLSLNIKNSEEFPAFPERIENLMKIESENFLKMLEYIVSLIPQNNPNPSLNGLLLEIKKNFISMTTTDGHCLAQISSNNIDYENDKTWLLPRRAVYELKKLLEIAQDKFIFIGICSNQLVFSGEFFNFFTKLLASKFPDYQSILDKNNFRSITIEKNSFIKTLKRSTCLLSGQFIPTSFAFGNDLLNIAINNKEVGSLNENMNLISKIDNFNLQIKFFAPYLLNGIQSFNDQLLTFYLKDNSSPIIFESKDNTEHITYLVMPVCNSMQ